MTKPIHISHKIELKPNNAAKTHFKKAFGCARLAKQLGQALPEVTPADLAALLDDLVINQIITSKIEAGMQLKSYS